MSDLPRTSALFAELAKALGVDKLLPDNNGGIQLEVGDDSVVLFAQDDQVILVIIPVAEIPRDTDFGTMLWLLKRNFYDSDLDLFRVASDGGGNLILWGRVPIDAINGESLLGLVDALAGEASQMRTELGIVDAEKAEK